MKAQQIWDQIKERVRKNFRRATLNFLFILVFINLFQRFFGPENSIVGVIFTIMMSASMVRDLTATPVRHLLIQAGILLLMAVSACFVSSAAPLAALPVNFAIIFLILYAFTYEYVSHLYFPYILSYLFLVFISPISPEQLPKRLLGVLLGAVSIILYQLIMGRGRVAETARDVLLSMIDRAQDCVACLLEGREIAENPEQLRSDLCKLSKIVYDRRRRVLCISDASFSMIDSGRGLENLVLLLYEMEGPITPQRTKMLREIAFSLSHDRAFMTKNAADIEPLCRSRFGEPDDAEAERFYHCLFYIRDHMLQMTLPEKKNHYHKTLLSFSYRLKAALHASPVRVVYALRVAVLLSLCTLFVQAMDLPYGKWLLFTVASVSMPYADDVGGKAKKRMIATLLGGAFSIVLFSLIHSPTGRTAVMILSGYLSFYFTDYSTTFACSTVGALGGAVFMGAFGWGPVGYLVLVRLGYIAIGILIALLGNLALFPFTRSRATRHLMRKYAETAELLAKVCHSREVDPQFYYSLVVQAHLQEEKLRQNAEALGWEDANRLLEKYRSAVRMAHRPQEAQ